MTTERLTGLAAAAALLLAAGTASADAVAPADVRIQDMAIADPLTGKPGDPAAGRQAMINRRLGNCLACHAVPALADELFHGDVGPTLEGVADRWEPESLRAIIVNPKEVFGDQTIMPGFYTLDVGVNVAEEFAGKTILSAQDVEDIVAYLATLKE